MARRRCGGRATLIRVDHAGQGIRAAYAGNAVSYFVSDARTFTVLERWNGAQGSSMKVTRVVAHAVRKKVAGNLWNPQTRWTEKEAVIAVVETDAGIAGVGEAWTFGGGSAPVVAMIQDLARHVVGRDPEMISAIWHDMHKTNVVGAKGGFLFHAISAIDVALWDVIGKHVGRPVYKLLGGHSRRVLAYASGGLYGQGKAEADLADEMAGYVERGFRAVKIKIGGMSIDEDVRRIAAVREAVGPEVALMVDGVWVYSARDAIELARRAKPYRLQYFEAPVPADDVEGCARVNREGGVPVCGHDHGSGLDFYRRLIAAKAVDYVLVAPIACGGLSEAMRIAAIAKAAYLPCTLHSSSTIVSFLACLHLGAALGNCHSVEFHQVHQMMFEQVPSDLFALQDGYVTVPERPGLGIDLDMQVPAAVA